MIKKIYIHAGVPKAGSTSIQELFFKQSEILWNNGFLYPKIKLNNTVYRDHSFLIQFLFAHEPETLIGTKLLKLNTKTAIIKAQIQLKKQITDQIKNFSGENLIISGEHLGNLDVSEIKSLKQLFLLWCDSQVQFNILFVCRHPVARSISGVQQLVKSGRSYLSACEKIKREIHSFYRTRISGYQDVFGHDAVVVVKFEEAIAHKGGIGGYVWNKFEIPDFGKYSDENIIANASSSYEGLKIIERINGKISAQGLIQLDGNFKYKAIHLLIRLPGTKFDVEAERKISWWKSASHDMQWLKTNFGIYSYEYQPTETISLCERWPVSSLTGLYWVFINQIYKIRKVVLEELTHEFNQMSSLSPNSKMANKILHLRLLFVFSQILRPFDKTRVLLLVTIRKIIYRLKSIWG